LLGLSFITEGAIPFIKKDKMVKYVFVISSMTAGILSVLFDVSSMIAHGGILAFFLANNVLVFLIILIASTVVFGFILGFILPKNKVLM
jgi:fructose PTS system EIIBC or EIIC component